MCVLAAQAVGLDIAGLDVVAADIGVPLERVVRGSPAEK